MLYYNFVYLKKTVILKISQFDNIISYCLTGVVVVWSYGSLIYNYLCNQCLSPLNLCVMDTTLSYKVCQWLVTGRWFSPSTPVSSTNKTEILLKVALNIITLTLFF